MAVGRDGGHEPFDRGLEVVVVVHEHARVVSAGRQHARDAAAFQDRGGSAEREDRLAMAVLVGDELLRVPPARELARAILAARKRQCVVKHRGRGLAGRVDRDLVALQTRHVA